MSVTALDQSPVLEGVKVSPGVAGRGRVSFRTLDAWRGFASIWVVMDHASMPIIATRYPQLRSNPLYAFSLCGALGVQIFFVISGFCIANAAVGSLHNRKPWGFAAARLRRIYPPYFFAASQAFLLSLLAVWLLSHAYLQSSQMARANVLGQSALYYFAHLTLTHIPLHQEPILNVFWTLSYEVGFYSIVFLLVLMGAKRKQQPRTLLDALHIVTIASLLLLIVAPSLHMFPLNLWPQFGFGVLVFDLLSHPKSLQPRIYAAIVFAQTLLFAMPRNYGENAWSMDSQGKFLFALSFAVVLLAIYKFDAALIRIAPIRLLSKIGIFSYSLYLTHLLATGIVLQLGRALLTTPSRFFLSYCLQIIAAILYAYFFYLCFERPFMSRTLSSRRVVALHTDDLNE
ncbi:MAG: acyltransferase [Planctomycetota bacterium]|nr:acyltransferase [Planctomycetota bacterium]